MSRNNLQTTRSFQHRLGSQRSSLELPVTDQKYLLAERVCAQTELSAMRDKLRSALALQAMNNAAMLASAEEHLNQIAPGGAEEYRQIVRAYAYLAARELLGGD